MHKIEFTRSGYVFEGGDSPHEWESGFVKATPILCMTGHSGGNCSCNSHERYGKSAMAKRLFVGHSLKGEVNSLAETAREGAKKYIFEMDFEDALKQFPWCTKKWREGEYIEHRKALRRKVEDKLRKEPEFLNKVLEIYFQS